MALIKCPECGKEVSNKAPSCIHCGTPLTMTTASSSAPVAAPVNISATASVAPAKVQTIELTGKKLKVQVLLSFLLSLSGCITAIGAAAGKAPGVAAWGIIFFIIGLIWFIVAQILIWWHHR